MGCCGCSNRSSAVTAGIFGLIQGLVGLILNAYFLNLYDTYVENLTLKNVDERLFLLFATRDVIGQVKLLLGLAAVLHSVWVLSSILLLIGNANDKACCIRQWVIVTAFIIIGDIILPIVVIIITMGAFSDVVGSVNQKLHYQDGTVLDMFQDKAADVTLDYYKYYVIFLLSFTKLGLITIIINICLNVFTNRRATEIGNTRGYVIGTTVTIFQSQAMVPNVMHVGPVNPGFPVVVQHGVPSASAAPFPYGNIPLQPASYFGGQSPEDHYEDPRQGFVSNPYRDEQADPLLPPPTKANGIC